jgi:hypothetical protein
MITPVANNKVTALAAAALSAAWLAGFGVAGAGELSSIDAANCLNLQVRMQNEAVICDEQIRRVYVTANTNTFAFILPRDFRLDASSGKKIVLSETDNCYLVMRIIAPLGKDSSAPSFREMVLKEHPGATILEEFSHTAAGRSGPAFDLQSTNSSQVVQCARIVFIPSPVGTVEISLRSDKDKFAVSNHALNRVLWSFCTDEDGPIKPMQTPTEPPRS